jgi:DNA polymerase-1
MIAIDTETYLIKGNNTPPLVCLSYCRYDGSEYNTGVITGSMIADFIERIAVLDEPIILHNASFDWTVLMRAFPRLMPTLFQLMSEGRVRCTMIREKLHKIRAGGTGAGTVETASGGRVRRLSLAGLAHKYLGFDFASQKAEGSVRYRYDELAQIPADQWEKEAVDYAGLDSLVALLVYQAQEQDFDEIDTADQDRQVRADFALQIMSTEGITVDTQYIERVEASLGEILEGLGTKLIAKGILTEQKKANTAVIKEIVEREHIARALDVPKTNTGEVSTAKDALKATEHPDLAMYMEYKKAQKLKQTYVPSLHSASHFDGRLRTRYDSLVQTGRTSSATPNLQNLPRKGGLRDCFVATEGYTLVLCDYDASEMRTLAQCVYDLADHMTPLLRMYQEHTDYDPHAYFGSRLLGISYEEMLGRLEDEDPLATETRQRAKPANFGYAGGMGASTFVAYASGYGVELTVAEAQELRDAWIETYDMRPWFREAEVAQSRGWVDVPRSGRRRGRTSYTQSCNTPFQGLASDGAKDALFEVARECYTVPSSPLYGSRPLVFIHDEIIIESPDALAPEAGDRLASIMCSAMDSVCPDVKAQATPALCKRWLKGAKSLRDESGRLITWEPPA